ncbi:MAG: ShlB/FhaC/HecB family hemolysin secretion/activation protein [Nitrospiraceae bacterium]|nr:MAG: ShlB/FhaC/HecB family hemolysin secretion/activation protein [Nitrospiraceae bacterium]
MKRITPFIFYLMAAIFVINALAHEECPAADNEDIGFMIRDFEITGNSLLSPLELRAAVMPFTGTGKTVADVEKARDALERLYHNAGYPSVIVNIPEQTLQDNIVKLEVIEGRIGQVKVTGNRYFTSGKVMRDLKSLWPGRIIYLPDVQSDIAFLNRNPDFKVTPSMSPGKKPGTIDIELKVEDRLPLHGSLELNNRASHDTSELRLNAMVRYDNLWQKEHSLSFQYQASPQKIKEAQVLGASYVLPSPWDKDRQLAFYGIWSDSDTAFGEGFKVTGKGEIFGARYVMPLPSYKLYDHNMTLGIDYKHFDQAVGFTTESGETTETPVSYLPLSLSYSASLPDELGGTTQFSGGLNLSLRGLGSRETEFEDKRFKARANYLYANLGIQRTQKLPLGMVLFAKVDGQVSDQPLIDNEQYTAGGMDTVRGYKESEASGDNGVHCTLEVSFPDPVETTGIGKWLRTGPYIFYDVAAMSIKSPLPGQDKSTKIEGAGAGVRGSITKNIEYELDWAVALRSTDRIKSGDQRVHFLVKAIF